jgi:hypothetical protein
LAKLAALPPGPQLEQALRAYNAGGGAWSYDPVRASSSDIVGARTPLLGSLDPLPWGKIERQIEAGCKKGAVQAEANKEVGKVLFDKTRIERWSAVKFPMGGLPIGIGESVRYWSDLLLANDDGAFIPFFDHRRHHGLSAAGEQQIVFSMQNIWVRERHPDLAEARLAIVRFPCAKGGRTIHIDFHEEADLLSYEELDARVRNVYETWARVSSEKPHSPRRATGTGDLFGD